MSINRALTIGAAVGFGFGLWFGGFLALAHPLAPHLAGAVTSLCGVYFLPRRAALARLEGAPHA